MILDPESLKKARLLSIKAAGIAKKELGAGWDVLGDALRKAFSCKALMTLLSHQETSNFSDPHNTLEIWKAAMDEILQDPDEEDENG